jgi:site-specific DNA recombinase
MVDRLTRSLSDFAKLVELFDKHDVSFVSVTQQFTPPPRWAGCP